MQTKIDALFAMAISRLPRYAELSEPRRRILDSTLIIFNKGRSDFFCLGMFLICSKIWHRNVPYFYRNFNSLAPLHSFVEVLHSMCPLFQPSRLLSLIHAVPNAARVG